MVKLTQGKINIQIDGQFGSTGKGLFAEYLSGMCHIDIAISNSSVNAGHTFQLDGQYKTVHHLPVAGILQPRATIYLCAGSIIHPETLLKEVSEFAISTDRLCISSRAVIITDTHIDNEQDGVMKDISSTQSGVGEALADKVRRKALLAKDHPILSKYVKDLDLAWYLDQGCTAFMEVPQGLGLSLNSGYAYPHCTSREVTVSSALSDAQLHPSYLGKVIMTCRAHPIRVGGPSGPFYEDSTELQWSELGQTPEITTCTKKQRRIATFSLQQYRDALKILRPDYIFLNFMNYLEDRQFSDAFLEKVPEVTHLGLGSTVHDILEVSK